jgi:hypothetical protein
MFALNHIAVILACGQSTAVECAKHTEQVVWRTTCHSTHAIKTVCKDRAESRRKSRESFCAYPRHFARDSRDDNVVDGGIGFAPLDTNAAVEKVLSFGHRNSKNNVVEMDVNLLKARLHTF